jgi:TRAP-type C4-dicarboxylate transport system substrate-binding protein
MRPRRTTLVLVAAIAALAAACGSGRSDKAGGLTGPVTLRIAAHAEHEPFARLFTDEVRRLSKGRIRIAFIPGTPDEDPADAAVRYARGVRDGRYDLGMIDAAAWDELGVRSLEPLQAPFLVTDQSLLRAVLASPLAARMLAGLRAQHVVGLALTASWLQHPVRFDGPLAAPADFRGRRILVPISRVNDAVMSALGATPVHRGFAEADRSLERHEIDSQVMGAFARPDVWLTANITFSADALTVIANERRFAKLSAEQKRILRAAAARATRSVGGVMAANSEARLVRGHCRRGRVVFARPADVAALEQATRPVYDQLERDPQVRATIAAIRELKRRTPPDPVPAVPASCSRAASVAHGRERDPSFLDGTYRWRITRAGARKVGADVNDPVVGTIATLTLRGGRWQSGGDHGTFTVVGDRIALAWPAKGSTDTFRFKRRADGTLDLTPVLPMDTGEQLVLAGSPLTRIGPPVRTGS